MKQNFRLVCVCWIGLATFLGLDASAADAKPSRKADPITVEMREALGRINRIHNNMDQDVVDESVEALHSDIARHKPEVFVPLAVPHLMRLAPKDTRTLVLLRLALANGWLDDFYARAMLIQAGDSPRLHIQTMMRGLDRQEDRRRAIDGLRACGAAGEPALPRLRELVEKAKADPNDYRRAYSLNDEAPEHVLAHRAIQTIESAMKGLQP